MLASAKAAEAAARLGESLFNKTFNFNSQICTSREQSERLLGLGLKKETADMVYFQHWKNAARKKHDVDVLSECNFPAWSLHRLLSLLPDYIVVNSSSGLNPNFYLSIRDGVVSYRDNRGFSYGYTSGNMYDAITSMISFLIKEGYFPKEYLEE